ncbi:MAG: WecB/TagA/CpsF family glycosyltransferase, partial [Armatimonadota bacterium]|nr:WecB/TagA/CpsF family glycosyltransferase [Armatimonadota bacterium]
VGKFDELLGVEAPWGSGEELDYVLRALRLGARIWYEPGLYVIHPRREPGLRLIRRAYRYGKGIGRVLRKHRYSIVFSLYMIARPFGGAVGSLLLLRPGSAVYYLAGAAGRLVGLIQPGPLEEVDKVTGGVEVSSLMSSLNAYRMSEVLDLVAHALSSHRGYIVTPNTDHVVRYHRDPAFRKAVDGAWLRLADGMPVVWASRLVGNPLPERVAGSDLLPELCRLAAERAYSVFFLGGRAGVARQAAENLKSRYRGLKVAGTYTPVEGFAQDPYDQEAAVEAVNRTEPDILFVGLGSPVQELWVHRNWDRLRVRVAVCCGAALDYAAGTQPRAPWWMRRAGLEWLWRLVHEPRRLWRRYLVDDLAFFGLVLQAVWAKRVRRRG